MEGQGREGKGREETGNGAEGRKRELKQQIYQNVNSI